MATRPKPGLLLMGHGSRDHEGIDELIQLTVKIDKMIHTDRQRFDTCAWGVLEFFRPGVPSIQEAIDSLAASGHRRIVCQPLLLLPAGHMLYDMPAELERAGRRHPEVRFELGTHLGVHRDLLQVVRKRIEDALADAEPAGIEPAASLKPDRDPAGGPRDTAVLLVGRGATEPRGNAELYQIARLLWEEASPAYTFVETAFVSLAEPSVPTGIRRCARLGARRIFVVPYFLHTGILVNRISQQVEALRDFYPEITLRITRHLGPDDLVVGHVLRRAVEAESGLPASGYLSGRIRQPHHHGHDGHHHDTSVHTGANSGAGDQEGVRQGAAAT